jgi:hypothetical protein
MAIEQNKLGMIVVAFIVLLVGITLLSTIANSTYSATHTQTNRNETISVATAHNNSELGWNDNKTVSVTLKDAKVSSINELRWSNGTILTPIVDYEIAGYSTVNPEAVTLRIFNTTKNWLHATKMNNTVIDYTYYPADYIDDGIGKTLLSSFLILFFVIGILATVIGFAMKGFSV